MGNFDQALTIVNADGMLLNLALDMYELNTEEYEYYFDLPGYQIAEAYITSVTERKI